MDSFKIDLQGIDRTFATHNNDVNPGFVKLFYGCLIQPQTNMQQRRNLQKKKK